MLDGRIYRAAFMPLLLAVVVVAFSLEPRPRPISTTLAADAFDGARAFGDPEAAAPVRNSLAELARTFPDRRPGSTGDEALAARIAQELRGGEGSAVRVTTRRFEGETALGPRDLTTVIAERTGRASRRIVVVAPRDALSSPARAELSATAALLELARVFRGRSVRRTLTLVSTSGSAGAAGTSRLVGRLGGPVDAILVLGDLASEGVRRPFVVPWSNGAGQAPLQLRRTVEAAVRTETNSDPGGTRPLTQLARLALPITVGEQGPLLESGAPAVLLQASGERGPGAGARVSQERLEEFGRAALRSITAFDNGPDVADEARAVVLIRGQVLPGWAIRLLGAALLLPVLIAVVDGFARVRRRKHAVGPWIGWTLAAAVPIFAAGLLTALIGVLRLLTATPSAPVEGGAVPLDGTGVAALVAVTLTFAIGMLALRPALARAAGARGPATELGARAGVLVVLTTFGVALWVVNPFAALLTVPAIHAALLLVSPEIRLRRATVVAVTLAALAPWGFVALVHSIGLDVAPWELPWSLVLLVAGGHFGVLTVLAASVFIGAFACAVRIAFTPGPDPDEEAPVTVRGPTSYAGPGSLGGTESALRR